MNKELGFGVEEIRLSEYMTVGQMATINAVVKGNLLEFLYIPKCDYVYIKATKNGKLRMFQGDTKFASPFYNMEGVTIIANPTINRKYELSIADENLKLENKLYMLTNSAQMPRYFDQTDASKVYIDVARNGFLRIYYVNSYSDSIGFIKDDSNPEKLAAILYKKENATSVEDTDIFLSSIEEGKWFQNRELAEALKKQGLLVLENAKDLTFIYHCEFIYAYENEETETYREFWSSIGKEVQELNAIELSHIGA